MDKVNYIGARYYCDKALSNENLTLDLKAHAQLILKKISQEEESSSSAEESGNDQEWD